MPKPIIVVAGITFASLLTACSHPPVTPLTAYADANGMIDVQALTCTQLNATDEQDANALATWYSGWYNGLAKKHFFNYPRTVEARNQVIAYCRAHPELKVIQAIAIFLKDERNMASR